MTARTTVLLFCVSLFVALMVAPPVRAQLNSSFQIPGTGNALSIELNPRYPSPNSSVQVSAESSFFDLSHSTITWYVNGVQTAQGAGATKLTVQTGGPGKEIGVSVTADGVDGSASAQASIIPNEVDILWESNSYTPPFYRGRALPSAGSSLRLEAMAHFVRADGTEIPTSEINYTWKQNGTVIGSASGTGNSFAILDASDFYTNETVSVDAVSQDGTQSGETSITIPTIKPVLTLYEDHPVFGVLYGNALMGQTSISDSEMAFAAIPYFAAAQGTDDPLLQYAWRVNEQGITADPKNPNEITVNAQNSSGLAAISLDLTHAQNIFLDVSAAWDVLLSGKTSGFGSFSNTQQ